MLRPDLQIIQQWIDHDSRVLDLGCGKGELLGYLQSNKKVQGYGLEINEEDIADCISVGVNVIEQNLDKGLSNFKSNSFDTVVMTQSLQALHIPDKVLDEMLRIGRSCIITFPNFGHWRCRLDLGIKGRMPISDFMPFEWYNTPNIHFCTFRDFEHLCRDKQLSILNRTVVDNNHRSSLLMSLLPNMFGETAIYRVSK